MRLEIHKITHTFHSKKGVKAVSKSETSNNNVENQPKSEKIALVVQDPYKSDWTLEMD
jgi:hypothetical protein